MFVQGTLVGFKGKFRVSGRPKTSAKLGKFQASSGYPYLPAVCLLYPLSGCSVYVAAPFHLEPCLHPDTHVKQPALSSISNIATIVGILSYRLQTN